jgi:hypothetical protein
MPNENSNLVELCGLWESQAKTGATYLSGTLGGAKVLVFRAKKHTDNSPDWRIYLAPKPRKDEGGQAPQGGGQDVLPF